MGIEKGYKFEEVPLLSAVAVGVPGKRTFFLVVGEKSEWLRLWLEKEQLEALSPAIVRFLLALRQEFHRLPQKSERLSSSDDAPSGLPSVEFEVDQVTISFEQEKARLEFLVHSLGPQRREGITVNCQVTLAQLEKLGDQARSVCAAGRRRCKLCGGPIDPTGHICPRRN